MGACSPSENHKAVITAFGKVTTFSLMQTLIQSPAQIESVHQTSEGLQYKQNFTKYPNNNHFMSDPISKEKKSRSFCALKCTVLSFFFHLIAMRQFNILLILTEHS